MENKSDSLSNRLSQFLSELAKSGNHRELRPQNCSPSSQMKNMRRITLCGFLFVLSLNVFSQQWHVGIFGGLSAYNGDLTDKIFPKKVTNGAIGLTANYEFRDRIMFRAG